MEVTAPHKQPGDQHWRCNCLETRVPWRGGGCSHRGKGSSVGAGCGVVWWCIYVLGVVLTEFSWALAGLPAPITFYTLRVTPVMPGEGAVQSHTHSPLTSPGMEGAGILAGGGSREELTGVHLRDWRVCGCGDTYNRPNYSLDHVSEVQNRMVLSHACYRYGILLSRTPDNLYNIIVQDIHQLHCTEG